MGSTRVVILPGLDGTDLLLDRFVKSAPVGRPVAVVPLPDAPVDNYEALCDAIAPRFRSLAPCHLIAESFSGPLGILLAHRYPDAVSQLTLVASFADSPIPFIARRLPWSLMFRIPMPQFVARYFFVGADQEMAVRPRSAIQQTSIGTLVSRINCLMNVEVSSQLAALRCHVDYILAKNDRLVSKRLLTHIKQANRAVIVREVDGPHLILQTRPQESWAAIAGGNGSRVQPLNSLDAPCTAASRPAGVHDCTGRYRG